MLAVLGAAGIAVGVANIAGPIEGPAECSWPGHRHQVGRYLEGPGIAALPSRRWLIR